MARRKKCDHADSSSGGATNGRSPSRSNASVQAPAADVSSVMVERRGHKVLVRPPCEEILSVLRTHRYKPDPRHAGRFAPWSEPLYQIEDEPLGEELWSLAGFEPLILSLLRTAGHEVEHVAPPRSWPKPEVVCVRGVKPVDEALMDFVAQHDRGLIRHDPRAVDPVWLVAQLALAFPTLTIVVIDPRADRVKRFAPVASLCARSALDNLREPARRAGSRPRRGPTCSR